MDTRSEPFFTKTKYSPILADKGESFVKFYEKAEQLTPSLMQKEPEQQKTGWKKKLEELASRARDAFNAVKNAAYRYWQSRAQ
jgi:hypothetical protein